MSIALMRRGFSLVIIAALTLLAVTASSRIVVHAEQPSGLYAYHHRGEPYEYPTSEVRDWITTIAVELVIASWVVVRTRKLTAATGWLTLAFTVWCFLGAMVIVDAPIYHGDHLWFVGLATLTLGTATAVLGLARRAARLLGWPMANEVAVAVEVAVDIPRAKARLVRRDT